MDAKHTPEPWRVHATDHGGRYITNAPPDEITSYAHDLTGECCDEQGYIDYARIVACVNAMVGIENPAAYLQNLRDENDTVRGWLKLVTESLALRESELRRAAERVADGRSSIDDSEDAIAE